MAEPFAILTGIHTLAGVAIGVVSSTMFKGVRIRGRLDPTIIHYDGDCMRLRLGGICIESAQHSGRWWTEATLRLQNGKVIPFEGEEGDYQADVPIRNIPEMVLEQTGITSTAQLRGADLRVRAHINRRASRWVKHSFPVGEIVA